MEEFIEDLRARLKEDPDLVIEIPVSKKWMSQDEITALSNEIDMLDEELDEELDQES